MILTISGLNAHGLFGPDYYQYEYVQIKNDIRNYLFNHSKIKKVLIGMTSGIELLAGLAVIEFNEDFGKRIELECVIPRKDDIKSTYTEQETLIYNEIIKNSDIITDLSSTNSLYKLNGIFERNRYMVFNSNRVLAYWDEHKFNSLVFKMIQYAESNNTKITIVNPFNLDRRYEY